MKAAPIARARRSFNQRLAYVALSRGRYDAQIYTNDKTQLAHGLTRGVASLRDEPKQQQG